MNPDQGSFCASQQLLKCRLMIQVIQMLSNCLEFWIEINQLTYVYVMLSTSAFQAAGLSDPLLNKQ